MNFAKLNYYIITVTVEYNTLMTIKLDHEIVTKKLEFGVEEMKIKYMIVFISRKMKPNIPFSEIIESIAKLNIWISFMISALFLPTN